MIGYERFGDRPGRTAARVDGRRGIDATSSGPFVGARTDGSDPLDATAIRRLRPRHPDRLGTLDQHCRDVEGQSTTVLDGRR